MRSLKIFDRIFNSRLKNFYFSPKRREEIEKSFSVVNTDSCNDISTSFHYSNILNIMTAERYLGSQTDLKTSVQELLNDQRIIYCLFYELIFWTYSNHFFRNVFFPKMQLLVPSSACIYIIRASQSGYLFINPKSLIIKTVWLSGDLKKAYSIKSEWINLFKSFSSSTIIEYDTSFCVERFIIGKSLSRQNDEQKAKFIEQYKIDLKLIISQCQWKAFDDYLLYRQQQLPSEINNILNKLYQNQETFLLPIIPQHGDFQFGNIIISDEMTIVIDWEAAFYGFGFYDFFVLTLGLRNEEFWSGLSFEKLCRLIDESDITDKNVTMVALLLLIEEYFYRNRADVSINFESNADKSVLDKIVYLFRDAHENIIH